MSPSCTRLFQSLAFPAWVNLLLHRSGWCLTFVPSLVLLCKDHLPPDSVTAQQFSVLHKKISQNPSFCHLHLTAFFPSSRPLLLLLLPTTSFSIHISGGRLWARVCICTIFSTDETYIFFSSPPRPPPLLWLIQILLVVLCCSSFFRLKAMCHSLLLSLCLFLHLFLLLPPTQSLSPLPTTFSLVSIGVVVCELLTACVSLCIR